jgi:hypothetical protein
LGSELSVFSDGFTLELAFALVPDLEEVDVIDIVDDLVQKSMVVFDPTNGPGRYLILMTLRQLGQENLVDAGTADEVRLRWANGLAQHLAGLADGLSGETELTNRYAIQAELSNITSVCEWSLAGGDIEPTARMLSACAQEISQYAPVTRKEVLAESIEQIARLMPQTSVDYPAVLALAGWRFAASGTADGSDAWFALADQLGDDLAGSEAPILIFARMAARAAAGRQDESVEIGLRQMERAVNRGDAETEALVLATLPFYLTTMNRHEESVLTARRSVEMTIALDRRSWCALATCGLGFSLSWVDSPEAIPVLKEAIAELELHRWSAMIATAERALARVITTTGDHREAARLLLHGLGESVTTHLTLHQRSVLFYASPLLVRQQRWEEAAIASGSSQYRLTFITSLAYAGVHSEVTQAIDANLDERTATELRAKGAAMNDEELIAWARTTLQSIAQT